jgi:hypothetical protein
MYGLKPVPFNKASSHIHPKAIIHSALFMARLKPCPSSGIRGGNVEGSAVLLWAPWDPPTRDEHQQDVYDLHG